MNTYDVEIIEILKTTVSVEAENADEAEGTVREKYDRSDVVLGAENLIETNFLVASSSEKLTNGFCTCGNSEFIIDEVSDATVLATFINGEMTVLKRSICMDSVEYIGLLKCKACGKAYQKEN